jgi:uncharacterized short protein YbdD (DUF466 family)
MIYKVLRGFWNKKSRTEYKVGTYVEIKDPKEVRLRIRRRDLLLARDQKGAKKLVGIADPRKYYQEEREKPQKTIKTKKEKQTNVRKIKQ